MKILVYSFHVNGLKVNEFLIYKFGWDGGWVWYLSLVIKSSGFKDLIPWHV